MGNGFSCCGLRITTNTRNTNQQPKSPRQTHFREEGPIHQPSLKRSQSQERPPILPPDTPPPPGATEFRAIFDFHAEESLASEYTEIDLKKGDIYQLVESNVADWHRVFDKTFMRTGFVPATYLQPASLPLEPDWFFKDMDRSKAVELLQLTSHGVGNYVIRNSSNRPNCFALSLRCSDDPYARGSIKHYIINIDENRKYFINEKNRFDSMEAFLSHYSEHAGGMDVQLKGPCAKEKPPVPNRTKRDMSGLCSLPLNQIKFQGEKLGKGFFGEVYRAQVRNRDVAVKTVTSDSDNSRQDFLREASAMNRYRHPNLVEFICVSYDENSNKLYLVSEYMNNGDLHGFLSSRRKKNSRFHINYMLKIGLQVLDGMVYLERFNVVHRDLRAQNVLVGNDDVFKISDFGLMLDENTKDVQSKFPIRWTAPEAIRDAKQFTTKSDVWSYGILMIEVVTMGSNPYPQLTNHREVQAYVMGGNNHPKPEDCPQNVYDVLTLCWTRDPARRPTFEGLKMTFEETLLDKDGQYNDG